ncbi:MAG: hypothetical protein KA734_03805 [Fluviicola sp.]|nr:hypothetical protein [Fluviicola sp.]MBP6272037.1 hypothetical protein [Fluviicola sp.]
MKILLIFSLGFITFSCQSEYERQLNQCKTIVNDAVTIHSTNNKQVHSLKKVAKEIDFHAHLSGNERLLKLELKEYTKTLVTGNHSKELLTSIK